MKNIFKLMGISLLSLSLVGCAGGSADASKKTENNNGPKKEQTAEADAGYVALITDFGNIDDKSFNQASWEGITAFTQTSKYKKDFFRAELQESVDARNDALDKAITAGAEVLVCPGYLFESNIYDFQTKHKDKSFILIDAEPKDPQGNVKAEANVYSVLYKEEEAGYLAGYSAVMEGYTKLGFLGGLDIPPIKAFGYGFIQGAEAAAKKLALPAGALQIQYKYAGGFAPTPELTTAMNAWYAAGTQVIFSCGGGIVSSVIEAAGTDPNRKIIGVDVDQSNLSENIIFSAMKGIANSVQLALDAYDKNGKKFPAEMAGKTVYLGIAEDCVGLSTSEGSWRMSKFTVDQYNALVTELKTTKPVISRDTLPKLVHTKVVVNK